MYSDPAGKGAVDLTNPQSWNAYAYVLNNPTSHVDPTGEACSELLGNTDSAFCQRAVLYSTLDAKLRSQTRFFGAADAVNEALADTASRFSRIFASGQTETFLEGVGRDLETMNVKEAHAIEEGALRGPGLDARMVHAEQTEVQRQLDAFRKSNPAAYSKTIGEINASLNPGIAQELFGRPFATDRAFKEVLDAVRKGLGRSIDFSRQSDREAIGNALIRDVRTTGGCAVTGSTGTRLLGCH